MAPTQILACLNGNPLHNLRIIRLQLILPFRWQFLVFRIYLSTPPIYILTINFTIILPKTLVNPKHHVIDFLDFLMHGISLPFINYTNIYCRCTKLRGLPALSHISKIKFHTLLIWISDKN